MNRRQEEAENALHDQENLLPNKQLILVFFVLAITILFMFLDQNGIGQILPTVAKDLNAADTMSWAGTSSLIGNTVFQVLYGRLSDIFGRKVVYLSAVVLLAFTALLCGFAQNATMLYVFRGMAGVAGGGITSLSMMIISDIVTLERRGKFQGILGSMVGLGNLVGPVLAATFAQKASWRYLFYMICPLMLICACIAWRFLPSKAPPGNFKDGLKKIDYWGVGTSSVALIMLLIPISGGGAYFEWNSPMVISMLVIGGLFLIAFVICEWKISILPIMPMNIWTNLPVASILVQNFLFGFIFYGYLYYLPLYYQNVRRLPPQQSAYLTVPLQCTQAVMSICSGQYITRLKRYGEVIIVGFTLLTISTSLTTLFGKDTPLWKCAVVLVTQGIAQGCIFQPTIISLQAHSPKSQRAIVISIRNFLRCLGGAVGLAVEAAILQNVLKKSLPPQFAYLAASTYSKPDFTKYSATDIELILDAYAQASKAVFTFCSPLAGLCLLLCMFVKDEGLSRKEDRETPIAEIKDNEDVEKGQTEKGEVHGSATSLPESKAEKYGAKENEIAIHKVG